MGALALGTSGYTEEFRAGTRQFGQYELIEQVARGGMGVVYKARQAGLNRVVAVKMIVSGQFASPADVERFRIEAEAAAHLQHPNIVAVHEVGEHDGQHFFSMEYVEGKSLTELLRQGPLSAGRAAAYLKTIAEAIHYAHECGILHRDLKPSNVLIDRYDRPRITDFGLAKKMTVEGDLTLTNQVLGSPNFMPPEQAAGRVEQLGRHSDVYSLGAILFCLITARPPFMAATLAETLDQVRHASALSPRALNPSVPRDLETICLKALEKDVHRRYGTALDLASDLARFLRGEPIHARSVSRLEKAWRWSRRHPAVAGLSSILSMVALVSFGLITWQWQAVRRSALAENRQRQHSEQLSARLELQTAEQMFASDNSSAALAHLARLLRHQPTDQAAAQRLISALTYRSFALPIRAPLTHTGAVLSAQFTKDATRVVSASDRGEAKVWDAATGRLLFAPDTAGGYVRSAKVSANGRFLLTAIDESANLWEISTGKALVSVLEPSSRVIAVYTPGNHTFLTAGSHGNGQLWDALDGKLLQTFSHRAAIESVAFSPDGRHLATASADGVARIWDVASGRLLDSLTHSALVHCVEFSPDGKTLATGSADKTARLWQTAAGKPLTPPLKHDDTVYAVRFTPDGTRILTASGDSTARVFETNGALRTTVKHRLPVLDARWTGEGSRFVTASMDASARVWDADTGQALTEPLRHEHPVRSAEFDSAGNTVLTAGGYDRAAHLWDVRSGAARPMRLRHNAGVVFAGFTPDGRHIVTACSDHSARIWHAVTGENVSSVFHAKPLTWASVSPDGERLVTTSEDGSARLWQLPTGEPLGQSMLHTGAVVFAQFSPDGKWVVTASSDKTARLWDASSAQTVSPPLAHTKPLLHAAFSPDSRSVVTSSRDATARVWQVPSGRPSGVELRHAAAVFWSQFSPDARFVATASADNAAHVWSATNGTSLGALRHNNHVVAVQFSPRSDRIATASIDGTARIWSSISFRPLTALLHHQARVNSVQFSPDGQRLLTASGDRTVRLWDAHTGQALSEPLPNEGWVHMAAFSPDGTQFVSASTYRAAFIWNTAPPPPLAPDWLATLAEAVGGQRLNEWGVLESMAATNFLHFKSIAPQRANDFYGHWARWFLADRANRSASP